MTAEIAILNKSAVALATDSMVTIASGVNQEKVYDSADKLFELSCNQPLGVMIYNAMEFAGIPVAEIIKDFRKLGGSFQTVRGASAAFLDHLSRLGMDAPESIKLSTVDNTVEPIFEVINKRRLDRLKESFESGSPPANPMTFLDEAGRSIVAALSRRLEQLAPATFFGGDDQPELPLELHDYIRQRVEASFPAASAELKQETTELLGLALVKAPPSSALGGVVIAGFGSNEIFPTLISFEVDGVIANRLKYRETAFCDIDREGTQAFVQPFAQKEMVERFVNGLDSDLRQKLTLFSKRALPSIAEVVLERLDHLDQETLEDLRAKIEDAERAFVDSLRVDAFAAVENESRREIEDMIQFMPKPELARMAEALVNLTSMKRKVSAGLETVGGPIDVAVISKHEGFVWIKRKHYFPPELNGRYFARLRDQMQMGGR